ERVEIQEYDRKGMRSYRYFLQGFFELFLEQQAVAETGQRVVISKVLRAPAIPRDPRSPPSTSDWHQSDAWSVLQHGAPDPRSLCAAPGWPIRPAAPLV